MMSGSEAGIMSGRESFGVGLQKSPVPSQPSGIPNMRLAFSSDGTAVYKPVTTSSPTTFQPSSVASATGNSGGGGGGGDVSAGAIVPHGLNMNMGEPIKRKRGRPRKYGPDGTMALALTPASPAVPSGGFSSPSTAGTTPVAAPSPSSMKKARGRPPGSGKKQQMAALGSSGIGFMPHVITVKAGEDVSSKIMSFSHHGPRAVCILSANGAISNVTLRQAATSGGTVTYEGRFEILSLSGSFLLSESGGQRSGGVAGLLTAATPVQVVVGSFIADGRKESKQTNQSEPSSAPSKHAHGGGAVGTGSPQSRGTLSESSGGPGSPLNQSTGACNNSNPQGLANMPWK
ncbi:AT-hook motif nuclear-localized protein 10-like isoform X2 [Telopea speciosissima]|uniref:AT-hook motif nuclear-localized protein 10-like isoform X2 n=1 Tax=Telopea speciosissima TaxID=54955 RepID=UPI001CC6F937|nr:AT-hook motif nuclear-localized protein 10-like isoform X2 [Telopea speciosissima]